MPVEPCEISAGPLRLSWEWDRDRYRHAIWLATESNLEPRRFARLAESVEGEPDELWPPSPVLQELHLESRADGRRVALLVGRAGRSHWSLSVLADPNRCELLFEAACRCGGRPAWLGSSYAAGCAVASEEQAAAAGWRLEAEGWREEAPRQAPRGVWLAATAGDRRWLLTPAADPASAAPADVGTRLIVAADWTAAAAGHTLQWRYRISMAQRQ